MKNKVIIDILERLICAIKAHNHIAQFNHSRYDTILHHTDDDYITYVEGIIEGLKQDNTTFDIPNSSIDPNDWIIYTNTEE